MWNPKLILSGADFRKVQFLVKIKETAFGMVLINLNKTYENNVESKF